MLGESSGCAWESLFLSSGFGAYIMPKLDECFMFQSAAGQECPRACLDGSIIYEELQTLVVALRGHLEKL